MQQRLVLSPTCCALPSRLMSCPLQAKKAQLTVGKEEDEWGNDELGDELLPL